MFIHRTTSSLSWYCRTNNKLATQLSPHHHKGTLSKPNISHQTFDKNVTSVNVRECGSPTDYCSVPVLVFVLFFSSLAPKYEYHLVHLYVDSAQIHITLQSFAALSKYVPHSKYEVCYKLWPAATINSQMHNKIWYSHRQLISLYSSTYVSSSDIHLLGLRAICRLRFILLFIVSCV